MLRYPGQHVPFSTEAGAVRFPVTAYPNGGVGGGSGDGLHHGHRRRRRVSLRNVRGQRGAANDRVRCPGYERILPGRYKKKKN